MSDDTRPLNNQHLMHLIETREPHAVARKTAEAEVRAIDAQILECLQAAGTKRHQLPNGTIVAIVQQKDRENIVAERLLGHGVSPAIIQDSTKYSPVAPFIRIDAPGSTGHKIAENGGARAAVAPAGAQTEPGGADESIH